MATTKELYKLYDLIQSGDVRSVERFLNETQIDVNEVLMCKSIGVLHLAVGIEPIDKSKECTVLLLKHGANPNLCNEDGLTPVHIAAIWGRVENLKLLIGCGGDPSMRDFDGLTAFDYAAREQQWDVYDYFHNVVEAQESFGSPCAYSLSLEKVLVTTDQMVAEYEPLPENQTNNTTVRKSEMVRQWCDKHSLVMNKLYPTILSDTFTIENDPAQWRSINITKNLTVDLTSDATSIKDLNETHDTFKTCQSKQTPVAISGIEKLEITSDESENSNHQKELKQRLSLYENFSLPGSPNSITHRNYFNKSTLNKKIEPKSIDSSQSLFTEDRSQDLDKALAVVQNKTNEWLSVSKLEDSQVKDVFNTRRSSASSGVSSNLSGGSIILANVREEYKYVDKDEDVVLIETRLLVTPVILPVEDESPDHSIVSVASSLPPSVEYDNNTLRAELLRLGFNAGPIQNTTRTLYLKKLHALKKNPILVQNNEGKKYPLELAKSLRSDEWMRTSNLAPYVDLEKKARSVFANPKMDCGKGNTKTSFTYLLLDPRRTNDLPVRASKQSQHDNWVTFIDSVFYVGKGTRSRPYAHLHDALKLWQNEMVKSSDKKIQRIIDIWRTKVGVICLHIFQNILPAEALTYEASMIDAIGRENLTNKISGKYYGAISSWPSRDQRMLGQYLLYRAMQIFLNEGERQLRPEDIDSKYR